MVYKKSAGEKTFDVFNYIFLTVILIVTLYPCYYVLAASVSDPLEIFNANGIILYPKGFNIGSYKEVMHSAQIWTGYRNTIFYVVAGTLLSLFLTVSAGFSLTRKGLPGRNLLTLGMLFTMYFSGGLIPMYLVVKGTMLLDTPLAMILPNAVNTMNLIITISYFRGIPESIEEAAKIDGASDIKILKDIMLPLAKPIIAVRTLYYMVEIWNNFFSAMMYLDNRKLYPLQLILREILLQNKTENIVASGTSGDAAAYAENVKYATIVVSTVPILCVYPFIQKYFVKGVMIGSVKG